MSKKETLTELIKRIVIAFMVVESTSVILSAKFPTIFGVQYVSNLTGINNATTAVGIFIGIVVYEILKLAYDEYM